MEDANENVVLWTIKVVVQKFHFISMSCDEVAIVNNQSWLFMNVYDALPSSLVDSK
jgi:hypothetical protein